MLVLLADLEQAHVRVPGIEVVQLANLDAVEPLHNAEQAVEHLVDRKPGTHLLLGDAVALLAQLLAVVADIPALQLAAAMAGGKRFQLVKVATGKGFAAHRKIPQKAQHLFATFGHLAGQ